MVGGWLKAIPGPGGVNRFAGGRVQVIGPIGVQEILDGVVGTELHAALAAGGGQLADYVAFHGCIHHVARGLLAIPHADGIPMLGRKDNVFETGLLEQLHPFFGVELFRAEILGIIQPGQHLRAPMDENADAQSTPAAE